MTRAGLAASALAVAWMVGLAPSQAWAAPSAAEREARNRFDEGEAQYHSGHYAEALAKYQAGYDADPLPGFLINIAQCQRRLGDLKTARATYRKFVLVAPDSRLVPEVETLIKQLDDLIADLPPGGSVAAPAAAEGGGDAEADVHARDPSAQPLSLAAPAPAPETPLLAAPAPDASAPQRPHARWWLWGGVAVAAIAGGVVTAVALSSPGTTTVRAGSIGTLSR
jgi:tetratricopeptide (TPR) repeat protein